MAKKFGTPLADETDVLLDPGPPPREEASPPDIHALGRAWLDKQRGIEAAELALWEEMRRRGVTASKPLPIGGGRYFPSPKRGRVNRAEDFA